MKFSKPKSRSILSLDIGIKRIGLADAPIPSTRALARYSYVSVEKIVNTCLLILNKKIKFSQKMNKNFDDTPDNSFTGPF